MDIKCPKCGENLEIPGDLLNDDYLACGACSNEFINPIKSNLSSTNNVSNKTIVSQKRTYSTTEKVVGIVALILIVCILSFFRAPKGSSTDSDSDINYGPDVHQSYFDHSIPCVERFLKHQYLRDPDSYESIHWSLVTKNADGTYSVTHSFRAKNGFGGMDERTLTFTISQNGDNVIGYN